jgi:inner membrane protein
VVLDAHWYWWALACLLIVLQILAGDMFFISLSFAAAVMGGVVYFFPESLTMPMQLLLFGAIAAFSVILSKLILSIMPEDKSADPYLNQPGARHIGTTITLSAGIRNGIGEANIEGSFWVVKGRDCPAGTHAKILGIDGAALKVEVIEEQL